MWAFLNRWHVVRWLSVCLGLPLCLCVCERHGEGLCLRVCSAHSGYVLHVAWPVGAHSSPRYAMSSTSLAVEPLTETQTSCLWHSSRCDVQLFRLGSAVCYRWRAVQFISGGWFLNRAEFKIMNVWLMASRNKEVVPRETCNKPPSVVLMKHVDLVCFRTRLLFFSISFFQPFFDKRQF